VGVYLDNVVNPRERALLDSKRLELGLTTKQAEMIERRCAPTRVVEYTHLVEGVLVDGVINDVERSFLKKKAEQMELDEWVAAQIELSVKARHDARTAASDPPNR